MVIKLRGLLGRGGLPVGQTSQLPAINLQGRCGRSAEDGSLDADMVDLDRTLSRIHLTEATMAATKDTKVEEDQVMICQMTERPRQLLSYVRIGAHLVIEYCARVLRLRMANIEARGDDDGGASSCYNSCYGHSAPRIPRGAAACGDVLCEAL